MFEIVVLSGKGGTGKTSVSAALATAAANECVLADCDVDAANMHVLMQTKTLKSYPFFSGQTAVIDAETCTACGLCEQVCHFDAIHENEDHYVVDAADCEGCGYCERVCPARAIQMVDRRSGDVFISESRPGIAVAHARLDPGADNSGKLVAQVKKEAAILAKQHEKQYVIVDGAPGIGCPVVSSLAGAKYVLLVTEPTQSAFHDLNRLVELLKKFRLKAGCILNKSDINTDIADKLRSYLQTNSIPLLAELPYDETFTKTMVDMRTMAEASAAWHNRFVGIWETIKTNLTQKMI